MFYRHSSIQSCFIKKLFGILFLLFIIPVLGVGSSVAQTWQTLAPLPQISNSSFFFDSNTGFAGSGATIGAPNSRPEPINIYRTTNGGLSWTPMQVPQNYQGSVSSIFMIDTMNGWASILPWSSSGNNRLWHTADGGLIWTEMQTTGTATCVYQTPRALILTDLNLNVNEGGFSTDSGATFTNEFQGSTNCIGFLNDTDGLLTVFRGGPWERTTDGGLTWNDLPLGQESWGIAPERGTSTYYCAGESVPTIVTKSTDKGLTWTSLHSFPFETSGDIHVVDSQTLYVQVNSNIAPDLLTGILRSTDSGLTWTNLGGPQNFNDSRFTVVPIPCGAVIYAFDTGGGAFKLTDLFNGSAGSTLVLATKNSVMDSSCNAVDTAIPIGIVSCSLASGQLDSIWLTGSSAFAISDSRTSPRTLAAIDSILVSFLGTLGRDTAELHIKYNLGAGVLDTTIQLIGSVTSPFLTQPAQIHREAASAYFGKLDSLTLTVDISSEINLDSLWPYITEIQATYSWDSSVAKYAGYNAPSGWILNGLANHGNAANIDIQNSGSTATKPLDLGTALFRPASTQLATSWVEIPSLVIDVGNQAISLCVTDNEDNHWAVKTLGIRSGVVEVPTITEDISIYPNPADDELWVQNTNELPASIVIYDVIGREVTSANAAPSSTSSIDIASLPSGAYFLVCHIAGRTETKHITKQ
jgi:Secretion system C-terminal sorting domain